MTNADVGRRAAELGHTGVVIEQTVSGRRWIVRCDCGWGAPMPDGRPTATRATFAEAVKSGQYHLRKAVRDDLARSERDGVSVRGSVLPRL